MQVLEGRDAREWRAEAVAELRALADRLESGEANGALVVSTTTDGDVGFTALHPMIGKEHLLGAGECASSGYTDPLSNDRAVVARDRWMVAQADILLVDLERATGPSRSLGTMGEIAWASTSPDTLIVLAGLADGSGMDHAFTNGVEALRFPTFDAAAKHLGSIAKALDLGGA